jgi:hypothetical protein
MAFILLERFGATSQSCIWERLVVNVGSLVNAPMTLAIRIHVLEDYGNIYEKQNQQPTISPIIWWKILP